MCDRCPLPPLTHTHGMAKPPSPTAVGDEILSGLGNISVFNPSDATDGLALLADVASQQNETSQSVPTGNPTIPLAGSTVPAMGSLSTPGPYSPAASLPTKTVRRILNLEFLEMSEIDDMSVPILGRTQASRPPVTDISQWVQRFSTMAAILSARFPCKAAELFAYQAQIVRAARNYEGDRWVSYDRQFRREALARKDLDWSMPNHRLYNEAFTGWARLITRCSFCLRDDHVSDQCPGNPNSHMLGWTQDPARTKSPSATFQRPAGQQFQHPSREVCKRFNRGRCTDPSKCRYRHACLDCQGEHPYPQCPKVAGMTYTPGRSRSPANRRPPGSRY